MSGGKDLGELVRNTWNSPARNWGGALGAIPGSIVCLNLGASYPLAGQVLATVAGGMGGFIIGSLLTPALALGAYAVKKGYDATVKYGGMALETIKEKPTNTLLGSLAGVASYGLITTTAALAPYALPAALIGVPLATYLGFKLPDYVIGAAQKTADAIETAWKWGYGLTSKAADYTIKQPLGFLDSLFSAIGKAVSGSYKALGGMNKDWKPAPSAQTA